MDESIEKLDAIVSGHPLIWFFLDYDGTLVEFSAHPDRVEKDAELIELIQGLASMTRFRVAIISGRTLDSLLDLVPVKEVYLASVYGIEVRTAAGNVIRRADFNAVHSYIQQVKLPLERILRGKSGFFLEDKSWSLAIHTEKMKDENVEGIFQDAKNVAATIVPYKQFRWIEGLNFLELAPLQCDKGETVKFLSRRYPLDDQYIIYCGDDDIDQEAFGAVHELGGVTIKITNSRNFTLSKSSDYHMSSPKALRDWLEKLTRNRDELRRPS